MVYHDAQMSWCFHTSGLLVAEQNQYAPHCNALKLKHGIRICLTVGSTPGMFGQESWWQKLFKLSQVLLYKYHQYSHKSWIITTNEFCFIQLIWESFVLLRVTSKGQRLSPEMGFGQVHAQCEIGSSWSISPCGHNLKKALGNHIRKQ